MLVLFPDNSIGKARIWSAPIPSSSAREEPESHIPGVAVVSEREAVMGVDLTALVTATRAAIPELDHLFSPVVERRRDGDAPTCRYAASTRTISLSSIAVTRNTSISLIAAPSRAFTRRLSICTAP
jgi:endonuclease YncB( thermonuclease family)